MSADEVVSTEGFNIVSHIQGDKSIIFKWEYGDGISQTDIVKLIMFMNDDIVSVIEPGNLGWERRDIPYNMISSKQFTVENLEAGKSMVFYLAAILTDGSVKYSSLTTPIDVYTAPSAFTIIDKDGRDLDTIGSYKLYVDLPDIEGVDKFIFISLASSNTVSNITYEFTPEDIKTDASNGGLKYFLIINLQEDLTYEISGFALKQALAGPISNTRWIISTQKTSAPKLTVKNLDTVLGSANVNALITNPGVPGSTNLFIYKNLSDSSYQEIQSLDITEQLYGADLDQMNEDVSINLVYNPENYTMLEYSTPYIFSATTQGGSLEPTRITSYNSTNEFYFHKIPEAPTINMVTSGDNKFNIHFTNGELYGATIIKYHMIITNKDNNEETIVTRTPNNVVVDSLTNYMYFNSDVDVSNGNQYDLELRIITKNLNDNTELIGKLSNSVDIVPFVPSQPPNNLQLNLDETVDSELTIMWDAVSFGELTGYLDVSYILLSYYPELEPNSKNSVNLTSDTTTHTITNLTNGTTYIFEVSIITISMDLNNIRHVDGEKNTINFVPWSLPSAPNLELTDTTTTSYQNVGNHYVRLDIEETSTTSNGLEFKEIRLFYSYPDSEISQATFSEKNNVDERINNLDNDVSYNFNAKAVYVNPNIEGEIITLDSVTVTATPTYSNALFLPRNLQATSIGDKTATITWNEPEILYINNDLSLNSYFIQLYTQEDESLISEISISNTDLSYTLTELSNGVKYRLKLTARYDDKTTTEIENLYNQQIQIDFIPFEVFAIPIINFSVSSDTGNVLIEWNPSYNSDKNNSNNYIHNLDIYKNNDTGDIKLNVDPIDLIDSSHVLLDSSLILGYTNNIYIRTTFTSPNDSNTTLTENSDSVSIIPFKIPNSLTLSQSNLDNDSVDLTWTTPLGMGDINYEYILSEISPGTDGSFVDVLFAKGTNTHTKNLDLGLQYEMIVKVQFYDPNNNNDIYSNINEGSLYVSSNSNIVTVTPFEEPVVGTLSLDPSNERIYLSFDVPNTKELGGLPITKYIYRYYNANDPSYITVELPIESELITIPTTTIDVTGLTNGVRYYFQYAVETSNAENPSNYTQTFASNYSNLVSAIPYTVSEAPNNLSITLDSGVSSQLTFEDPTDTGGQETIEYIVTKTIASGVPSNVTTTDRKDVNSGLNVIQVNEDPNTIYGQTVTYYVKSITRNPNNDQETLEGGSVFVSKIYFETPAEPEVTNVSINDLNPDKLTLTVQQELATGIDETLSKFVVELINVDDNSTIGTYDFSVNDINTGQFTLEILQDISGQSHYKTETVYSVVNPNTMNYVDSSVYINTFQAYSNPVLSSFYIESVGDRYITVAINEPNNLNLNFTNFQYHEVSVSVSDGSFVGIKRFDQQVVSGYTTGKITLLDNNISLLNDVSYTLSVFSVGQITNSVGAYEDISSNILYSTATPKSDHVPEITGHTISSESEGIALSLIVNPYYMDVTEYVIVFIPNNLDANNQYVYESKDAITVGPDNDTITLVVNTNIDIQTDIYKFVAQVKNVNGWSDHFTITI